MENCTIHVLPKYASFKPEEYSSYIGRDLILLFRNEYAVLLRKANLELLHRFREDFTIIDLTSTVKQIIKQTPNQLNTFAWLAEGAIERYIGLEIVNADAIDRHVGRHLILVNTAQNPILLTHATKEQMVEHSNENTIVIDLSGRVEQVKKIYKMIPNGEA